MTPDELVAAMSGLSAADKLQVIAAATAAAAPPPATREDLQQMLKARRYDDIERMRQNGDLDHLYAQEG